MNSKHKCGSNFSIKNYLQIISTSQRNQSGPSISRRTRCKFNLELFLRKIHCLLYLFSIIFCVNNVQTLLFLLLLFIVCLLLLLLLLLNTCTILMNFHIVPGHSKSLYSHDQFMARSKVCCYSSPIFL